MFAKKGKRLRGTWENPKNVPNYLTSSNYKSRKTKKRGRLIAADISRNELFV